MKTFLLGLAYLFALQTAHAQMTQPQVDQMAAHLRAQWAARVAAGTAPTAVTEPSITAGRILTPAVDVSKAPGVAAVQLNVDTGSVGIAYVAVGTVDPTGMRHFQNAGGAALPPLLPQPKSRAIDLEIAFNYGGLSGNLYVAPGTYTIYIAYVVSRDGTMVTYEGSQLTSLFNRLAYSVANPGTPDTAPPTIGRGAITTPVISLSKPMPYFAARLAVMDDLSGISVVSLGISNGGGTTYFTETAPSYPFRNVTLEIALDASPFTKGTYTITSVNVCDAASNCATTFDPAKIMSIFSKTTFQVTN